MKGHFLLALSALFLSTSSFGFGIDPVNKAKKDSATPQTAAAKAQGTTKSSSGKFYCDSASGTTQLERKLNSKCDSLRNYSVFLNKKGTQSNFCCISK